MTPDGVFSSRYAKSSMKAQGRDAPAMARSIKER
jgi:hypothetical protein